MTNLMWVEVLRRVLVVVASLVVGPLALLALCMLSCTLLRLKGETDERAARGTDRSSAGAKTRRAA